MKLKGLRISWAIPAAMRPVSAERSARCNFSSNSRLLRNPASISLNARASDPISSRCMAGTEKSKSPDEARRAAFDNSWMGRVNRQLTKAMIKISSRLSR